MSSSLPPRHKKHTGKKHQLRLLLVNCKSVCNKCGRFQNLMDSNNPDVVVVTESCLTPNHPEGERGETDRFCSKYQIHRRDRVTDTSGGGVFIAVKNDLKSTRCSELKPTDCELMWVKIEAVGEKAGSKHLPVNYRPVSLTCVCSKAMEHVIVSQVNRHLESLGILDRNQHGFRRGLSTETQLIDFIQELHTGTANGKQVDAVVMDFSKARGVTGRRQGGKCLNVNIQITRNGGKCLNLYFKISKIKKHIFCLGHATYV